MPFTILRTNYTSTTSVCINFLLCTYVNHVVLSVTTLASVLTTSQSTVITSTVSSTSVLEPTTMLTDSPILGRVMHMDIKTKMYSV